MKYKNLQIIYKNNQAYGIRDKNGYLLFFLHVPKYNQQEERFRKEIEEQSSLANYLLEALKACQYWEGEQEIKKFDDSIDDTQPIKINSFQEIIHKEYKEKSKKRSKEQ